MLRNAVLLSIVIILLFVTICLEYGNRRIWIEDLASRLATRLEIPETRMQEELAEVVGTGEITHVIVRGTPLCAIATLLTFWLIKDWKAAVIGPKQ